jgi:hypothetical protein
MAGTWSLRVALLLRVEREQLFVLSETLWADFPMSWQPRYQVLFLGMTLEMLFGFSLREVLWSEVQMRDRLATTMP